MLTHAEKNHKCPHCPSMFASEAKYKVIVTANCFLLKTFLLETL